MKKLATIALTVAALSLAFTLASCSGGSSGGGSSSDGSGSSGLPATSPYGSSPASDAAGASSALTLLENNSSELNNKIFKRVYDDDGETKTKYYLFANGNCYESSSQNVTTSNNQDDDDPDIIGYGGKFYREAGDDEFERISGSGLFATFRDANQESTLTFKSDGTLTFGFEEDGENITIPGYFRNVSGVIDMTIYTPDGETFTTKVFYDGTYLTTIDSKNELIFVANYNTGR
ncbi:MAG TPA: hypothetical protein DCP61_07620 [Treponema sp.]|nr:hypothetical protein [Treponema sp.]